MSLGKYLSNLPSGRYFWFLMVNVAVTGLASTMLGPFLPIFLYKQLGISVGAVSSLYFASGLAGTFTVLIMGWLVDRVGRKKVYAFGTSSAAIIPAALATATTFSQAFPIITISGVMDSASRASQTTIIADQVEESKRNTAYGVSRIVSNAAWIVAPLMGGAILAGQGNFLPLFLVSAFIGLIGFLAFIGLVPESRKTGLATPKLPKIEVLRDRELLVLCVASLFTMLFYTQFYSLLPIFATQVKGLDSLQVGALFSISGATVVVLQFPTSRWLEKIPKQSGYILGVVILAVGITSLALAPNFYWLLVAVVVMTLGENMFFPIAQTLVTEIAPEAERGMYVGAFSLFLNIGGNVSPLLGGAIWQLTGNANLPWLLSPVYAAISVALAIVFRLKRPSQ
ncbi:MAG: MFS transporter [Candidatus Bathyarchaeia archaeon]